MKTLKDIKYKSYIRDYVYVDTLRKEVIKWVKDVRVKDPEKWYVRCEIIMIFHNITKDDLDANEVKEEQA